MPTSKNAKRLVRRLMKARSMSYQAALMELRGLPEDVRWAEYVQKLERDGSPLEGVAPVEKEEKP